MFKHLIFLFTSHSLFALTTLHVSLSSDNSPGTTGDPGDLRSCLNTMNQGLNTSPDDYAIVFDFPMTITLNGTLPLINNSSNAVTITIGNPGSIPTVTIDGNSGAYSGFFIPNGNVTIQNMVFQNLTAKGGNGGDGTSGGGGGMGAGGAIYAPEFFLNGSNPSITLMNVEINNCSAVGGNGGSYLTNTPTGDEGGGGGGGFGGDGGSITTIGSTGGGGGGGFGGDGGNVTLNNSDPTGGGGGGGGGLGTRATMGMLTNLGIGGSDNSTGSDGNGYDIMTAAGPGGGGNVGGNFLGGGGGGSGSPAGGGGGGSQGTNGNLPEGSTPPGNTITPSGGNGGDGGGGGGGGVVITSFTNFIDGQAGSGGYGGGGGGGAGTGASDVAYTVKGGTGGVGGGGGGGGADQSGTTLAGGGNSLGGGGGGGGGPSNSGSSSMGGSDTGSLGGGAGGSGANGFGSGFGGGGGGGGSGLGGAIFVDSNAVFTIQAISGIPTIFNTSSTTTQAGNGGMSNGSGGTDGTAGSALGNSIFLRQNASLTFLANDGNDLLTLGDQVAFVDDTNFGAGGTAVFVKGNGTVVYNGTTDYQGSVTINNANFKVNGEIDEASIQVCRDISFSSQRGTLSGTGVLTGDVFVNSGTISPDTGGTLTLGSLELSSADPISNTPGSLVHIEIDSTGTSLVHVNNTATLAGLLEIDLDPSATPGSYTVLTSSGITGTFDSVAFTGRAPNYSLSYLPIGSPTFVQFDFLGFPPNDPLFLSTAGLGGNNLKIANYLNRLAPDAAELGLIDQFVLLNGLSPSQYRKALEAISPSRNSIPTFAALNVMFMFSESLNSHFNKWRLAHNQRRNNYANETAYVASNDALAFTQAPNRQSPRKTMYGLPKETHSKIWGMGFGQFSHQNWQDQTPAFNFNSGGFFAAYDYGNTDQGYVGTLVGYAFSSIDEHHSMGNSHLDAGYLSIYGTKYFSDFFIDAAVWGEYMRVDQKRTISFPGFKKAAKSSYNAEQLDLHFGMGYDFNINTVTIEPFGVLDWVYEWDPSYKEKGAAPYNMKFSSRTSWMLRFETGLNVYNTTTCDWGIFIVQGKLSYVYKKPHHVGRINAAIVNAPASFVVEAFTAQQSLVSPGVELYWQTNWNGFASISYNGEFGSGYNSNQFYGRMGYAF
ncbi:MAG TPA: autotransporter domain-containing protein [Rhabdochlamydiaceae bacterium]|nr:autotransporter domain-containing protein [Rhabdochlamydiaceae bacterium]